MNLATPTVKRCARGQRMRPAAEFPRNPRMQTGLGSWCLPCAAERTRQWRAENPDYVGAVNTARREGPFPKLCSDCGEEFQAKRRASTRCSGCQKKHRQQRKR
jgi:hypothetical protein